MIAAVSRPHLRPFYVVTIFGEVAHHRIADALEAADYLARRDMFARVEVDAFSVTKRTVVRSTVYEGQS